MLFQSSEVLCVGGYFKSSTEEYCGKVAVRFGKISAGGDSFETKRSRATYKILIFKDSLEIINNLITTVIYLGI